MIDVISYWVTVSVYTALYLYVAALFVVPLLQLTASIAVPELTGKVVEVKERYNYVSLRLFGKSVLTDIDPDGFAALVIFSYIFGGGAGALAIAFYVTNKVTFAEQIMCMAANTYIFVSGVAYAVIGWLLLIKVIRVAYQAAKFKEQVTEHMKHKISEE